WLVVWLLLWFYSIVNVLSLRCVEDSLGENACNFYDYFAICNEDLSMPHCTCSAGWTGKYCNSDISDGAGPEIDTTRCELYDDGWELYDNICVEDDSLATCNVETDKPRCTCSPKWTGEYCDTALIDPTRCEPWGLYYDNICVEEDSAAICNVETEKPRCTCSPKWTGVYCDIAVTNPDIDPTRCKQYEDEWWILH
ncbi:hypothetical protein PMAYCL1PPCAC_19522, partial [Pristionchus mayeri]